MERQHQTAVELLVGFYKRDSEKASITWPESVDVALCFGWIDGVRRRIDEVSYTIRFTPRRPTSIWSAVNVKRVAQLETLGLMTPTGRAAFEKRIAAKTAIYSYDRKTEPELGALEKSFRANRRAWKFFQSLPPGHRRTVTHWVVSPKREETRQRRLAMLIAASGDGKRIDEVVG
jgi:uncharacterized protein YdeI (YjbR/CyaY-like superfamily)